MMYDVALIGMRQDYDDKRFSVEADSIDSAEKIAQEKVKKLNQERDNPYCWSIVDIEPHEE